MKLFTNTLHSDNLREFNIITLQERVLVSFSYVVDRPSFLLGFGIELCGETPLHVGVTLFGLRCYLQLFSIVY